MSDLAKLLEETLEPEPFVRRALGLLEADFRTMALLALADWDRAGRPAPELARAIAGLTRPSWGAWNGLLAALRAARRNALRDGGAEARAALGNAAILRDVASLADRRADAELQSALEPLATLTGTSARRLRWGTLLAMPIALRNRVVHDSPTDDAWWKDAAAALRPLVALHAADRPCLLADERPAPWFHTDGDGTAWSFAGLTRSFAALEVSPDGTTREDETRGREVLLAFSRILGRAETQTRDFEALLRKLGPDEIRGVIVGDYLVGAPVGRGGFATVHVARQLSTGRKVALKVLHDGLDEDARVRFQQEASYLSQLQHPGIARVIGFGEETWRRPRGVDLSGEEWFAAFERSAPVKTFLALEWIDGRTLDAVFRDPTSERAPDHRALAAWLGQAAASLGAVHAQGLIHRDVKPGNLMVEREADPDGGGARVRLMDFGIARSQSESRTLLTQTGTTLGTPAYMSPEQLRALDGEAEVGPASDLYGLGATFYELFTGRRIFDHDEAGTRGVETRKLAGELPPRPRQLRPELPWEIEMILLGLLQPEVVDRYRGAEAVLADVERYLADEPITWRRPSLPRRVRLGYRRHRTVANLLAAFVVLALLGVVVYVRAVQEGRRVALEKQREAETERAEAERQREEARKSQAEAERQATIASRRAQIAREALASLVHEVRNELDDVAGPRARLARGRLLEVALAGFEKLRDAEVGDAPISIDAAEAHRQVADLAREAGGSQPAIVSLESALGVSRALVAGSPRDPVALRDLVYSLRELARVLDDVGELARARALLEEAIDVAGRWREVAPPEAGSEVDAPDRPLAERDTAALRSALGEVLKRQGQTDAARRLLETALSEFRAIRSDTELPNLDRDVAVVSLQLGEALYTSGEVERARALFAEAVEIMEGRLAAEPEIDPSPAAVEDVSMALGRLGRAWVVAGNLGEAKALYTRAAELARRLHARDPRSVGRRTSLAQAERRLGELHEDLGELHEALARFEVAYEVHAGLTAEDPSNDWLQIQEAVTVGRIGRVHESQGDLEAALRAHRSALEAYRAIVGRSKDDVIVRRGLAASLRSVASVLERQGRSVEAGEGLAESVEQTRRLLAAEPDDEQVRYELAAALRLYGDNLLIRREIPGAVAATEESVRLLRSLTADDGSDPNRDVLGELVIALQDLGDVLIAADRAEEALERLEESLAVARQLAARDAADSELTRTVATALSRAARVEQRLGRLDRAIAAAREAEALFVARLGRDPTSATARRDLAQAHLQISGFLEARGDVAGALAAAGKASELVEALVSLDATDLQAKADLAEAWIRRGALLEALGRGEQSLEWLRRAIEVRREIAARSDSVGADRDLKSVLDRAGFLLVQLERLDEAKALIDEALALARAAVEATPEDPVALRGLSVSLNQVGYLRRMTGDLDLARASLEESLAIARRLADGVPEDVRVRRDVVVALIKLGEALFALERNDEALAAYEEAGEIAGELTALDPGNASALRDRAVVWGKLTEVHWQATRLDAAIAAALEAVAAMRALHELDPSSGRARRDYAISLVKVGYVKRDRGDLPGSVEAFRAALAVYRPLTEGAGAPDAAKTELARIEEVAARVEEEHALASGSSEPTDPVGHLKVAYATMRTRAFRKATHHFEQAFTDERVRRDLQNGHLYRGACIASLASAEDAQDEADAERLRGLAVAWIAEDLMHRRDYIARVDEAIAAEPEGTERLGRLQSLRATLVEQIEIARVKDGDLAAVRATEAFQRLFEEEPSDAEPEVVPDEGSGDEEQGS